MTKLIADSVLEGGLTSTGSKHIKDDSTEIHVVSGDPADRATVLTNSLASNAALTSGDFTGPADGDTSGRKLTKDQETALSIGTSGTAAHICIIDGSEILVKTSVTPQALTSGGTVTINAFDIEFADAT